jgi:hypothetical protein
MEIIFIKILFITIKNTYNLKTSLNKQHLKCIICLNKLFLLLIYNYVKNTEKNILFKLYYIF